MFFLTKQYIFIGKHAPELISKRSMYMVNLLVLYIA